MPIAPSGCDTASLGGKVGAGSARPGSSHEFTGRHMGLTVLRADARAGAATDAGARVVDDHDLAVEFAVEIVVVVLGHLAEHLSLLVDAMQMHHVARAHL